MSMLTAAGQASPWWNWISDPGILQGELRGSRKLAWIPGRPGQP